MRWMFSMLGVAALLALAVVAATEFGGSARAGANSMAAMSLDMDPDGTPANTATTLGSLEGCARIDANGVLDADEDTTADTVTVDVTAEDIPASAPMQGFQFMLDYDEASLTIQSLESDLLVASAAGSNTFYAGDTAPDTNGDDRFLASVLDLGPAGSDETGSGVLGRLTVSADAGATAGLQPLVFVQDSSAHTALGQETAYFANTYNDGWIAIDQVCEVPTPTPAPLFKKGDVDCDDDVDSVDALKDLRHAAGLTVTQSEGCTPMGEGQPVMGDMDCDDDVDSVDALRILRHVAGLSNTLPDGCPQVGS